MLSRENSGTEKGIDVVLMGKKGAYSSFEMLAKKKKAFLSNSLDKKSSAEKQVSKITFSIQNTRGNGGKPYLLRKIGDFMRARGFGEHEIQDCLNKLDELNMESQKPLFAREFKRIAKKAKARP